MLRVGLFYPNARAIHTWAPSIVAQNPDLMSLDTHIAVAEACECGGLDYLFMGDAWGPYGPKMKEFELQTPKLTSTIMAAALFSTVRRIRFITTVHTSWFHPLQIARICGALDQLSGGRLGLNIVSGSGFADAIEGDIPPAQLDHEQRYIQAAEVMEIVTQHWSQGRIDFDGEIYRLHGEIVGPATVQQPRPLIVSAGASSSGREFAGRYADYIFMPGRTPREECLERVEAIREVARAAGRPADSIKMQMHASVIVRESAEEAREVSEQVASAVDLEATAEYLNSVRSNVSTYDDIYAQMGELQLREIGMVSGARKMHGSADEVADEISMLVEEYGCDGLAIALPVWTPKEIERFCRLVLPRLEARGLWRHPRTRSWAW